jgi:hypothetical protein
MIGCPFDSELSSNRKGFASGLNQWPEHPAREAAIALEVYVHTQPAATPTAMGLQGTTPRHLQA